MATGIGILYEVDANVVEDAGLIVPFSFLLNVELGKQRHFMELGGGVIIIPFADLRHYQLIVGYKNIKKNKFSYGIRFAPLFISSYVYPTIDVGFGFAF